MENIFDKFAISPDNETLPSIAENIAVPDPNSVPVIEAGKCDRFVTDSNNFGKNELQTLLAVQRLLMAECILKLSYSQHLTDWETLYRTLDNLEKSPDLSYEIIIYVPSLVQALVKLSKCENLEIHSKARTMLGSIWANISMSTTSVVNEDEMLKQYHILSAIALAKSPHLDAVSLCETHIKKDATNT